MKGVDGVRSVSVPSEQDQERLKKAVRQLEGIFVEQLFKAMRESIPEGGLIDGGSGEEIFTGLMDQHLAEHVPAAWESGLAEALYRQLRGDPAKSASTASDNELKGD